MKFQWIFGYAFMLQWTIKKEDEMEIICGNYISSAAEKGYDSDDFPPFTDCEKSFCEWLHVAQ